jgi:hypothetical protein
VTQTTSFSAAGLAATSQRSDTPADVWHGEYDLLICVSGWDERSVAVTEARRLRAHKTLLVFFDERDSDGLREHHDGLLSSFAGEISELVEIQTGSATSVKEVWAELLRRVRETFLEVGRPLNVFLSASTCPRYHSLALLGVGVGRGYIRKLSIAYSDGVYPDKDDDEPEISFTGGTAAVLAIPGLEGVSEPEKARFFLVSIGFEGWRSMRAVVRAEPDRVCILLPDPGSSPSYVERALHDNQMLIDEYGVGDSSIIRANASDVVDTWRALSEQRIERPLTENTFYLCTGTKPHSLALALRAMQLGTPAVLYSVPEEFRVVKIKKGAVHWRYDILSTAIPSPG